VALYVIVQVNGLSQEITMLVLMCYLFIFLAIHILVKPFHMPMLNLLELVSISSWLLYYLTELATLTETYNGYGVQSITTSLITFFFVVIPTCVFYLLAFKSIRFQALQFAYFRNSALFNLLSCGVVSSLEFSQSPDLAIRDVEGNIVE